jgi:hypothetical protein
MVVHACNHSTQEAEAGGSCIWDSLDYAVRLFLKKKHKQQEKLRGKVTYQNNMFLNSITRTNTLLHILF